MAPSYYLNRYSLINIKVPCHLLEGSIINRAEEKNQKNKIVNCVFEVESTSPREYD